MNEAVNSEISCMQVPTNRSKVDQMTIQGMRDCRMVVDR